MLFSVQLFAGIWKKHISNYPSPKYLNYNWGFGSTLGLLVALQVITGLFLSIYYRASEATAFADVVYILNEVNGGYIFKYLHLNIASFIFFFMYLHLFRGVYYRAYAILPKVWLSGVLLFVLMILTAFLGYVLPWGQMSYWAATVITNLVTSIPFVGTKIIVYIHGAFSVQSATLGRFFILHYFFALIVAALAVYHITVLHAESSTNAVFGRSFALPRTHFYYYYLYKDLFVFLGVCLLLVVITFQYPNMFNHPDNFNEANPLVTPTHIVPEWYFLPFYAILRAIPNKLLGVVAMLMSLVVLALLPMIYSTSYKTHHVDIYFYELFFWALVFVFIMLGYLGSMPAEAPYVELAQFFTFIYFTLFGLLFIARWTLQLNRFIYRIFGLKDYDW